MRKSAKQCLAWILAVVQLAVLFPLTALAENATATETPVLNKTVVGTVAFQSFNFLGDNDTGEDGTDYHTTFYYTDDYFAPSAINNAATSRTMLWSDLDNPELATCSFDFAIASYTSAKGDVIRASSQTWNNTDYSDKDKNVKQFLDDCGFTNIEPHGLTERPTNDSIGYTLGSKEITVWNADSQKNETYTLIAVGCRGAGYGAEWASNITIGDPSTNALPANGRHYGFDHSAQIVCEGIRTYLSSHSITGNVKYWVTGFSRAAAVANLVAGYLTDGGSTYKTQQKDVFGYTWECPQAAKTANTNFTNYKNIHNILNPMDAVPKVSPDAFEHQRLGVDYQMPYHGNVSSTSQNTTLYNQMYNVLKTIAVGNGSEEDPLIETVNPSNYPYNKVMTIYKMDGSDLMGQVVSYALNSNNDTLLKEFGTVEAEHKHKGGLFNAITYGNVGNLLGWNGSSDYKTTTWYLDDFINNLVTVFLTSNAWIGGTGNGRTALQNRATFISNYQNDFRTLFGYFLDFSGPAFLGMMPKLIDAVTSNIGTSLTSGFAWDFVRFYNDPSNTSKKNNLISSSKTLSVNVANDMVTGYPDPEYQGITKAQMNAAMQNLAELVINLYSYELSEYDSQYLGTTLRYLNTILCTHEQETVLSWIMSLDPNHMNRSCRTITIPAGCDATLYEFRPEIEGDLKDDLDTSAPVVAEVKNGALVTQTLKDQRIYCSTSGGNLVIRYPASLQIRADIKSASASGFNTSTVSVADYQTTNAYINVSNGKSQYETTTLNTPNGFRSVTSTTATNVTAANTALSNYGVALAAGDTLHILADEIGEYNENKPQTYKLSIDKAPDVTVLDYGTPSAAAGTDRSSAILLGVNKTSESTEDYSHGIKTRQTQLTIPASSVYYDDDFNRTDLSGNRGDTIFSSVAQILDVENTTQYWYQFKGSRVDVYCTTYNQDGTGESAVTPGYVQAKVLDADNHVIQTATIRNQSDTVRYNVPTISFDGLTPGQDYYLVLNVLKSSNYKLDGIRVYNSIADQSNYEGTDEQYGAYISLREALVNNGSKFDSFNGAVAGALFIDDTNRLDLEQQQIDGTTGEPVVDANDDPVMVRVYEDEFEAYQKNSPKNEIYLDEGEAITFTLTSTAQQPGTRFWIGLSAPDKDENTGRVKVNGQNVQVTSAVDTYYEITDKINANGSVTITNDTDHLISVTNLKITGNSTIYNAVTAPKAKASALSLEDAMATTLSVEDAMPLVFAPLTMRTVMLAANDGVDPETAVVEPEAPDEPEATATPEPTPEPTPIPTPTPVPVPTPTPNPISSFLNSVFRSIGRLFGF